MATRRRPRSPLEDRVLRPHEEDVDAHPALASRIAALEAGGGPGGGAAPSDALPTAIEPGDGTAGLATAYARGDHAHPAALATIDAPGLVQFAPLGDSEPGRAVRADDPRLEANPAFAAHIAEGTEAHGGIVGRAAGTGAATRIAVFDAEDQIGGDPALTWIAAGAPLAPVTVTSVTRFKDAVVTSPTEVRLTPDSLNKTGAIFHDTRFRTDQDWSIAFEFKISGTTPNGDGIIVRMYPDGLDFGAEDFTVASAGVGVEVDTYLNAELSDPAVPHIAIHGTQPLDHADPLFVASVSESSVTDGNWHTMVVSFDAANNEISVTYDAAPVVSGTLNIGAVVGPAAYIGLVGFNGGGGSRIHDVRNWSITGVYEGGQLARADIDGRLFVTEAPTEDTEVVRKLELDAHLTDTTAAHAASAISFVPAGDIAATNVQLAIEEVSAESRAYTHVQVAPSDTWVVVHNLGRYPSAVAVIDSGGSQGWGAIVHDSINQLTISFGTAFSGRAEVR